jgi:predicted dehydrogenase
MNTKKDKIGVAVVGLGVGEQHAKAYLATGGCDLRWVYDLDTRKAQEVVSQLGTGTVANSFEQILEDSDLHVVSIASFDDAHYEQVLAALNAEKHVFVEKPLCRSIDELRRIKDVWSKQQGRLKLSSNLVLRAAPLYRWLKQRISADDFGDLYAFDGDYLYGRLHKITDGWRKDVKNYSVMEGGGVHLIDLMLWLTGERPSFVWATGNRICTRDTQFRYDDYVAATLQCPSGLVGRITANFGCVHRHQHSMRIFGTKETFVYDDAGPRLHDSRDPDSAPSAIAHRALPQSKGDLIDQFVSAVKHDEDLNAQTQEAFDVISICAACDRAVQSKSTEEVQYI